MAYIANRPVRFDRNYQIGEVIPDREIDPKMVGKLISMGRIICVDIPNEGGAETAPDSAGTPTEDENGNDGINGQADTENTPEGQTDAPEDGADETEDSGTEQDATDTNVGSTEDAGTDTDTTASPEFVCEVCGKAFVSKNALSAHSRTHKK